MTSPNPYAIDADTLSGMKPLRKVVYSIGSNLGDRLGNLQGAVDAMRDTPDVIVVDVSSVYETDGRRRSRGQPGVPQPGDRRRDHAGAAHPAGARPGRRGRVRPRPRTERWGPRTLDVDLIMVGNTETDQDDLKLPHPLAHERGFVLAPWAEIDPRGELPGRRAPSPTWPTPVDLAGVVRRDDLSVEGD